MSLLIAIKPNSKVDWQRYLLLSMYLTAHHFCLEYDFFFFIFTVGYRITVTIIFFNIKNAETAYFIPVGTGM